MDLLSKTIKKLSDEEYQALLAEVSGKKKNKPYMVLETSRMGQVDDGEMMELLQVNPSTYYTLKSRLNSKIAAILAKKVNNPISVLLSEVIRVPANLYGSNRDFSVRALKELEKQLIQYDLSSELIVVYKTLAQLNLYNEEYDKYELLYKKHVAFSLGVAKVERLYYEFIRYIGDFRLSKLESDKKKLSELLDELSNFCELYDSHRMFVFYNIANIYYMCIVEEDVEILKNKEIEIENVLKEMSNIFEKYNLDTFYQNIKFLTDLLLFEYYTKTKNQIRAEHYLEKINPDIDVICPQHISHFYVVEFLNAKIEKFLSDGSIDRLIELNSRLEENIDIDSAETYHYIAYKKYKAICKFYQKDFSGAARIMNELRNELSMKKYLFTDIECKLFQALQYCIMGEDGLCTQLISSLKRQIKPSEEQYASTRLFIKFLKTALKPAEYRRKIKKVNEQWLEFTQANTGKYAILTFLKLDEGLIRRITNPIKDN